MGRITIKIEGSFERQAEFEVSATEGGHATAIHRAVRFLTGHMMGAIRRDHQEHEKGNHPPESPFGTYRDHAE